MKRQAPLPFIPRKVTIGEYLSLRLQEIGIADYFVVPGDYNLILLDEILKNKDLTMISCCNELNAGYAADGYARARGAGAVFVTFFVGSLSLVNAIAGAYSDDLPVIVVSGGPNSNDFGTNRILHHTLGISDKSQPIEIFKQVTVDSVIINNAIDAPGLIDRAISNAMKLKKPVYIEICCNVAQHIVNLPVPMAFKRIPDSNPQGLALAVEAVAHLWNEAVKPVLIAGVKLRPSGAVAIFQKLAEALGGAVAVMPNAKSFFPEDHDQFIGTYWGMVSSPSVCETIESADLYIYVGPVFNDYTTTGYSTLVKKEKMIEIYPDRVKTPFAEYGCIYMSEFLEELSKTQGLRKNSKSLEMFKRLYEDPSAHSVVPPQEPLSTKMLVRTVQSCLRPDSAVIVETGDSWFNGQKLDLPHGVPYEFQMQYGSIGWSVGAVLGNAAGYKNNRRCIALIGDGSFQITAQEVSTMIRYNYNPIIFLLNNRGYTIEVEIHDGPYNNIKNWNYTAFVDALADGEGKVKTFRCDTVGQLEEGVKFALNNVPYLVFLECTLDRDDCSKELLEWGTRVASANGRAAHVEGNY